MANLELRDAGDGWLELRFDQPNSKANVLTRETMMEFEEIITGLEKRKDAKGVVITSGKDGIFIAGADIALIQALSTFEDALHACTQGQQLIHRWSLLPMETVAAIGGACLGGGFELSLACKKRVASTGKNVKIGLPEVQLGILPGFGGSIRLPRTTDLPTALDMILTGRQIDGMKAFKTAIVSAVLPPENFNERAIAWAKKNQGKPGKRPKGGLMGFVMSTNFGRAYALGQARKGVVEKTKGFYPAPLKILDLLGKTIGKTDTTWCLEQEAKHFASLAITPISKRLIELFLLTESVKKSKGAVTGKSAVIDRSAVLGAGIMGGGIAHAFANVDIPIRMKDINWQAVALGYQQAGSVFGKAFKRRKLDERGFQRKMAFISGATDYSGFKSLDVVVEAVVENMDVKKKVLAECEKMISENCIFASNTSSLSITEMAKASARPDKVAGLHFFNPVDRMPLVEVIAGEHTSADTIATLFELSKRLKKTPVVVKDCPGFLVNRLLLPYMNEAIFLLEEGVSIERLDQAMLAFGMPMGPLRLADEVGLDTAAKVAHILNDAYGARAQAAPLTEKVVASGRLGRKNSKGFYVWVDGRATVPDEGIYEFVKSSGKSTGLSDQDLVDRMLAPMINEAALALDEEIVESAAQVDLALIMGTGFPPFRGGLLRHADTIGVDKIRAQLERYSQGGAGERLRPNGALSEYADRGKFYS